MSFYVYYWYVVVWAIKESPNLYGDSYNCSFDLPLSPRKANLLEALTQV